LAELTMELGPARVGCMTSTIAARLEEMTALVWPREDVAREMPVGHEGLTDEGRFMGGWPWPLRLERPPRSAAGFDVVGSQELGLCEGEHGFDEPSARAYQLVELVDGRRALGVLDPDDDELVIHGWFD